MLTLVVLLSTVFDFCQIVSGGETSALGEAFYVPDVDLVTSIPNGVKIFSDIPEECIEQRKIGKTSRNEHYYKDTSAFYKSISTSTQLDASYQTNFAMGATLDATTKHVSSTTREVTGTSLKLTAKKYKKIIQRNCLLEGNFIDSFKTEFEALESTIKKPSLKEHWRKYHLFLQKYGSHVVTGIVYGASIDQYVFAKSSNKYSKRAFTVKACAELAGPVGAGKLKVKGCAGVDSEEISRFKKMDVTKSVVVSGGTFSTRAKVRKEDRSTELLDKFLEEGSSNPGPIHVILKPVWEILQNYYSSKEAENLEKAFNLEYYFNGYLNFGCTHRVKSKIELQKFEKVPDTPPGSPAYRCTLAPEGCHSEDDCHYHIGVWCNCQGDTCIRYSKKKLNTGVKREEANPYKDSDWAWQGCDWKVWGSWCSCLNEKKERKAIWSSSNFRDVRTKNETLTRK
uniref:Toxin candidate TRINITY_DN37583_c0_g1_i1.p1 n=1 Tax=Pachycerianthus maua TaxID=2736681 RepID=A0A7G7WYU3_9CNID|nr:toxin candidate TRINITY_DN37583_c0_g1_i1.p1 [Pachycerianthus maua]